VGDRGRQNRAFIRVLHCWRDREGQGETPSCGQIAVKVSVSARHDGGLLWRLCRVLIGLYDWAIVYVSTSGGNGRERPDARRDAST
jgi:hypothetical protein